MVDFVKPSELTAAATVYADDALIVDNGGVVQKATPVQVANAGAPVSTQAQAIAGTDNSTRMTPFRVRQVLDDTMNPSVLRAEAWAESAGNPDPANPSSKSAKTWSGMAEAAAEAANKAPSSWSDFQSAPFIAMKDGAVTQFNGVQFVRDRLAAIAGLGAGNGWRPFGDVYPEHYGETGSGRDNDLITAASLYAQNYGVVCRLMPKEYVGVGRAITVSGGTPGVTWIGCGSSKTSYRSTSYDAATWPMADDCSLFGVTVDAGGMQTGAAGKGAVIRYASRCVVRDTVAKRGYTPYGPGGASSDSRFYNIRSEDCESRGWQAGNGCHGNEVFGFTAINCGKSVVRIAGNAAGNKLFGVYGRGHNAIAGCAIWIAEGAHNNLVDGLILEAPAVATAPAIQFDSNSYGNTVCNFHISGHTRLVEHDGQATSGTFPDVGEGHTMLNRVYSGTAIGVTSTPPAGQEQYYYAINFSSDGTWDARQNTVEGVYVSNFYGLAKNGDGEGNATGCDGSSLIDIRTGTIGAGGILRKMRSASDRIWIKRVSGFPLSATVDASISVDSVGMKTTALTNHGLKWTPRFQDCTARLQRESIVGDFRFDTLHVVTVNDTSVQARCFVGTASATSGATAMLTVDIHHREDTTFPLSAVNP